MFWWTSDYHFDHKNMIKYENRPYANVREMNNAFIHNTNEAVARGDVLIIAGDITLQHNPHVVHNKFLSRIHGNKIILKGNHDYWMRKGPYIDHRTVNGHFISTSHYPMRSWNRSIHGAIHAHGHSHGNLFPFRNQLDISIDNAFKLLGEYRPFNLDEMLHIIHNRKATKGWRRIALRYVYKMEALLRKET